MGKLKAEDPNAPIQRSFPALNKIRLPFVNPPAPRDHFLRPVSRFFSKYSVDHFQGRSI